MHFEKEGSRLGRLGSIPFSRGIFHGLQVEDEDTTELETFGGVLRSSIDDPIEAFLKARWSVDVPQAMRCEGVQKILTWRARLVPNEWRRRSHPSKVDDLLKRCMSKARAKSPKDSPFQVVFQDGLTVLASRMLEGDDIQTFRPVLKLRGTRKSR